MIRQAIRNSKHDIQMFNSRSPRKPSETPPTHCLSWYMSTCTEHLPVQHIYWMSQHPGLQRTHSQEKHVCNYQVMGMIFLKPEIMHSNEACLLLTVPVGGSALIPLHCSNHLWSFPPGSTLRAHNLFFWIFSVVPNLHQKWTWFLAMAKSESEPSLVNKMCDQMRGTILVKK